MKIILLSISLFAFLISIQAQQKATTEDGKIVILLDDGTWQPSREVKPIKSIEKKGDCEYTRNKNDEFTGNEEIILKEKEIAKGLVCTLLSVAKTKAFFLNYVDDLGCLTSDSYVIFKFTDSSTLRIQNGSSEIDCGDGITFQGMIGTKEMTELSKKEIGKIRLSYSDAVRDLDVIDGGHFLYGIPCLLK